MASLRAGFASAVFSTLLSTVAMLATAGGCASPNAQMELPPLRDFSVEDFGVGGNGGDDLGAPDDLATGTARDLATASAPDLSPPRDLMPACFEGDDGGATPTLWMAAPAA